VAGAVHHGGGGCVGAWQLNLLPIDVTPDITNKQVQINTIVETLSRSRWKSGDLPHRNGAFGSEWR
jgi:hypothetical protein